MSIKSFLRAFCGRQFIAFTGTSQRLCALPLKSSKSTDVLPQLVAPSVNVIQARGYKKKINMPKTLIPLNFDGSGDLAEQASLDPNETHYLYKDFKKLESAPTSVMKILSLEFATGSEKLLHRHLEVQDKINQLTGPAHNLEKQIAYLTVKIQNLKPYIISRRMDKKEKAHLILRIKKRNKLLRYLRNLDIDRFDWLTNELQVKYQPVPQYNRRESRRAKSRRLLHEEANELKRQKISGLRERFKEEKNMFLKHKEQVLDEINTEICTLGLDRHKIKQDYEAYLLERTQKLQEEYRWKNKKPGKFAQYYLMNTKK